MAKRKRKGLPRVERLLAVFWQHVAFGAHRLTLLRQAVKAEAVSPGPTRRELREAFTRDIQPPGPKDQCFVCEKRPQHRHHVIQIKHGGTNELFNLVWLCSDCHETVHPWMKDAHADLTYDEYRPMWWPAQPMPFQPVTRQPQHEPVRMKQKHWRRLSRQPEHLGSPRLVKHSVA